MEGTHWTCPNCKIVCAIEMSYLPENIVKCKCNYTKGHCDYFETVTETKKRLEDGMDNIGNSMDNSSNSNGR